MQDTLNTQVTELLKTQIAYQHFTLEEWKTLAFCVLHTQGDLCDTKRALDTGKLDTMFVKFPSAAL